MSVERMNTTACRTFTTIGWSKRDTDETIREVKIHNAKYRAVCK